MRKLDTQRGLQTWRGSIKNLTCIIYSILQHLLNRTLANELFFRDGSFDILLSQMHIPHDTFIHEEKRYKRAKKDKIGVINILH